MWNFECEMFPVIFIKLRVWSIIYWYVDSVWG